MTDETELVVASELVRLAFSRVYTLKRSLDIPPQTVFLLTPKIATW